MNRQQRKHLVKELVTSRDLSRLSELAKTDKRVVGVLCALLFEQDERFRWRTIEAIGVVSAVVADTDLQSVRELLRRLEWLMNDESGGAGWHSPEAMAAIVVSVPALMEVFGVILGSYLNDDALSRGAHWAVAVIAKERPDLFSEKVSELTESLRSDDPHIRGYAVIALASLSAESIVVPSDQLSADEGKLVMYSRETGELTTTTVGDLVRLATSGGSGEVVDLAAW